MYTELCIWIVFHILIDIYIVDYAHLMTQKTVIEVMTDIAAEVFAMKIVVIEGLILAVIDVDADNIDIEMVLIS